MAISAEIAKLFVTIGAETKDFFSKMGDVDTKTGKVAQAVGKTFSAVGKATLAATAVIGTAVVKMGVDSFNAAKDFETAFAGVKKTVNETANTSYADLEKAIRDMSKELPSSANEIAAVAEVAGQLGIETDSIMDFTKAMLDLGNTTNLSATEGAASLAQFANVMQMSQGDFDRLGSVIVDLGNNMATTEADIVMMGQRLAGAGKQVGMSEAEVMSFAAALSSVGIEAEAGGSAFSKVMVNMQLATKLGGEELEQFAAVAGKTSEEFAQMYEEDAAGALNAFVQGLGTLEDRGMDALVVLDEMGISEVRMRDALLRASNAGDLMTEALDIGTTAWEENTAMAEEANKRYETTESQMAMLKNTVTDLAIGFGQKMLPAVNNVVKSLNTILSDGFQKEDIGAIGDLITTTIVDAVKGISSVMPEIVSTMVSALTELISVLVELLPTILPLLIDGAIQLLEGIITALSDNADMLGEMVTYLVLAIANFIIEMLPKIIEVGLKLLIALAQGIAEALPELIPAIVDMLLEIVNIIFENMDLIIGAALDIIVGLVQGLAEALPTLIAYIPELITAIVTVLIENLPLLVGAGVEILLAVIGGIIETIPTLITLFPDMYKAIGEAFFEMDWASYGSDILYGIGEGIMNAVDSVVEKAKSAASSIADAVGDFFGIASPSKLMMGYGEDISEGLALGIEALSDLPQRALDGLVPTDLDATIGTSFGGGTTPFDAERTFGFGGEDQNMTVSGVIRHEGINDKGELIGAVEQIISNKLQWESMMMGGR